MSGSFRQSEREKQGGTEVRRQNREGEAVGKQNESVLHLAKHLQGWQAFGKGVFISSCCCSYSQVGRVRLSLYELNKGTLVYSQAQGTGAGSSEAGYYIWL